MMGNMYEGMIESSATRELVVAAKKEGLTLHAPAMYIDGKLALRRKGVEVFSGTRDQCFEYLRHAPDLQGDSNE